VIELEKVLNLILNKLESLDHKVDSMGKRLDTLDQKVSSMDKRLNGLDQKVSSMDKRLTADLKRHEDHIQQLIHSVAATNVKMNEMNEKLSAIDAKADQAIEQIADLKESAISRHDLAYYDQKISEHSRQIYKLNNQ
jgi:seryl-tRNA synthetase